MSNNNLRSLYNKKLSYHFISAILLIFTFVNFALTSNHVFLGNGSVFPLHALNLIQNGSLDFEVINEMEHNKYLLTFHTPLYTLWLSFFYWIFNLFTDLNYYSINLATKIANLVPIILTGLIFSKFLNNLPRILTFSCFIALPTSFFAYLSSDMDQVLVPLFLLAAYYCIEKKKNLIYISSFFALAIITKENTAIVFMTIILFGQSLLMRNIAFLNACIVVIISLSMALLTYMLLCLYFSLDPYFLFTTGDQISAGTISSEDRFKKFLSNSFVQGKLLIQSFSPLILLFLPALFKKDSIKKAEFKFLFILFFSVFGISAITGYVNIRYFSSIAPIMLLLAIRTSLFSYEIKLKHLLVIFIICIAYLLIAEDQYMFLSKLSSVSVINLIFIIILVLFFCIATYYYGHRSKLNAFIGFSLCSCLLSLNIATKGYQIHYFHGNHDIGEIIKETGDSYVFSDLPSAELYLRGKVLFMIAGYSHYHNYYGLNNPDKKDMMSEKRKDYLISKSLELKEFVIWTNKESSYHKIFDLEKYCNSRNYEGYHYYKCNIKI